MKKLIVLVLAIMLVSSMTVPAYAHNGNSADQSPWLCWFSWWSGFGSDEPNEAEPVLAVPAIKEARFYHTGYIASLKNRLQIQWEEVDGAESYEIEVIKADGSKECYTASSTVLMVKNTQCPQVYSEKNGCWESATVRIRAVNNTGVGKWSKEVAIGCDTLH